jgi:hypothetical protein
VGSGTVWFASSVVTVQPSRQESSVSVLGQVPQASNSTTLPPSSATSWPGSTSTGTEPV